MDAISILELLYPSQSGLGLWLLPGGTVLLIAGLMGIGRQHFKTRGKLYTGLVVFVILIFIFYGVFGSVGMMILNAPMFPLRSEITQVTVVNTSPLILSLNVKAITSKDTRIDSALILSQNDNLVAEYYLEPIIVVDYYKHTQTFVNQPICELPAGSEITLTLNFNTTLPSGNYTVRLSSWASNHGSSPFTIP